jgi:hypothetical protein
MKAIAAIVVSVTLSTLVGTAARADILEWQDAEGVLHYTNLKDEVPPEQQSRVVVDERARQTQAPAAEEKPQASAGEQAEPRRDTAATDDRAEAARAYVEGLENGLELARSVNTGGSTYVSGPLVVTISGSTPAGVYPPPWYSGYYPFLSGYYSPLGGYSPFISGYYPLLTTAFGGHRFHRQQKQLAQVERPGFPFTPAAGPPPLGLSVGPVLRGFPTSAAGPPPLGLPVGPVARGVSGGTWR